MREYVRTDDSKSITSVDYNSDTSILHIRFTPGGENVYMGVPKTEFQNLLDAKCKSAYLKENIEPNYESKKVV